jgi:hypothetical protein
MHYTLRSYMRTLNSVESRGSYRVTKKEIQSTSVKPRDSIVLSLTVKFIS